MPPLYHNMVDSGPLGDWDKKCGCNAPHWDMAHDKIGQSDPSSQAKNGLPDISILEGREVGEDGDITGPDGTLIGKITEGDVEDIVGYIINRRGEIIDEDGVIIGRAGVIPGQAAYMLSQGLGHPGLAPTSKGRGDRAEPANEVILNSTTTTNNNTNQIGRLEAMIRELQIRADAFERDSKSSVDSSCSSRRGSFDSVIAVHDKHHGRHDSPRRADSFGVTDEPKKPSLEEAENSDGGRQLRIRRMKELNTGYSSPKLKKDDNGASGGATSKKAKAKNTLTVIREFDPKDRFWRRRVDVGSPAFADLLSEVSQHDCDISPVDGVLHLIEPLMCLFHNRKQLTEYAESNIEPTQAKADAKIVLDFMRADFGDVSRKLDDLESSEPSGLVTYSDLWLLYPPGTIVYTLENGEYEAFVVDSLCGMQKRQQGHKKRHGYGRLDLTCWSINYDGEVFGRVWSVHCIAPFHGTREIGSLDLVPERFLPKANTVRESLLSRGKQFWTLQGQQFKQYIGEMWSEHSSEGEVRVMVDHMTYQRRNEWPIVINKKRGPSEAQSKNWRDNRFSRRDDSVFPRIGRRGRRSSRSQPPPMPEERDCSPDRDSFDRVEDEPYRRYHANRPPLRVESKYNKYDLLQPISEPDELTLLLCPQRVHGYSLHDKTWKDLNVTQLQPVAFRKNAWERLVLDEEYKDIVQAMVSSYVDKTAMLDDLVAGKGAGLVALLHGPPGSGKTLTAECVADSFEKPLYQVTCGDVGTDPERLEERLEEIFDYAVTWGAILLLDEADIFLQDRDYTNLQRNALVSIFLRTLEYFDGILFLTTNRVGTFDQAFQSRIHVTLGLPSLDQPRRISVWDIFVQDLKAKGTITEAHSDALLKLVKEKWSKEKLNGRQIRNSVRTALVVAEKKGSVVGEKEFETVLKIGREFEGYMGILGKGEGSVGLEGFQEVDKP